MLTFDWYLFIPKSKNIIKYNAKIHQITTKRFKSAKANIISQTKKERCFHLAVYEVQRL